MSRVSTNFVKMMDIIEDGGRVVFTPQQVVDKDGGMKSVLYIHKPVGSERILAVLDDNTTTLFNPTLQQLAEIEAVSEYSTDWTKVEMDTPVVTVKDGDRYHFAKFEDGVVFVYPNGMTSFTYDKEELVKFLPEQMAVYTGEDNATFDQAKKLADCGWTKFYNE